MENKETKINFDYGQYRKTEDNKLKQRAETIINDAYNWFVENHHQLLLDIKADEIYSLAMNRRYESCIDNDEYLFFSIDKIEIKYGELLLHLGNRRGNTIVSEVTSIPLIISCLLQWGNINKDVDIPQMFFSIYEENIHRALALISESEQPAKKKGWFA